MPSQSPVPSVADLRGRLPELMLRDERRLRRRLDRARRHGDPGSRDQALARVAAEVAAAEQRAWRRRAAVPAVRYPPELPVSRARDELLDTLRAHQVVVVAGETGSGKTTQLPKLCLELGRGVRGTIGHTQPRRIAARTVSARIAEELGVELGQQVGYQVRFSEQAGEDTLVKVMTDGILLAEIQGDPQLRAYDTVIVDEAHERSLTIDFLLGYLHRLLPRRRDLKVVITSATIDPERFSRHFGGAPVVEVSGRTYPVEVRYRPLEPGGGAAAGPERDQADGICDAVTELVREGPGDILVFLSGEREIRDTADALAGLRLRDTEILPLYARLSPAEQQRAFQPHRGRRVVLATNVAETSVTVPGIRYVVDPGRARISRYSARTRVQRLPIEKVSQASASQRAGRCGRQRDGICIRLYSEDDFEARPAFTEPEILRTNLASVILQMAALGLGDVEAFGFVDPPDRRSVRDAVGLLHELGAVASPEAGPGLELTAVGRTLARLPVDPRIGRMIVEGDREGCLREVLVIAAALSIQDPRLRPPGREQQADAAHAAFADESSDFLTYLELWRLLRRQQRVLSSSAFRRWCREHFLHSLRVREWQDLHAQLRALVRESGMHLGEARASPDAEVVHRTLLAGLLSHVGLRDADSREFAGARGGRFAIWPGSALARTPPEWVMAAELVETARRWGRTVAPVDPRWAEQLGAHVVSRTYSEPRWSAGRGAAVASEKVTLYGVPLVAGRTVAYTGIDPELSRELFLRHALVGGEWDGRHAFVEANRRLLEELGDLEHRTRRRDLAPSEDALFDFYDERVPDEVTSARHFDTWWKTAGAEQPDLLTLRPELLRPGGVDLRDYPDGWPSGGVELRLRYRFEPGAPGDGVTVEIPLALLGRVRAAAFTWQVPGLREELVTALVRSLPKELRRGLVPVPDVVQAVLGRLAPGPEPLTAALSRELRALRGVRVPPAAWDPERLPDHLRMTFRVVDGTQVAGQGKDLDALRRHLAGRVRGAVAEAAGGLERRGLRAWPGGELPRTVRSVRDGHAVQGFPALVDEGATVGVRVLLSAEEQARAMWQGTRRLLLLQLPAPVGAVHARLPNRSKLVLARNPHGSVAALLADCTAGAVDALMAAHGGPRWDEAGYARLRAAVAAELEAAVAEVARLAGEVLEAAHAAERTLEGVRSAALAPVVEEGRAQLARLAGPGFVAATGRDRLGDLARYVRAVEVRVAKAGESPDRDRALAEEVAEVQQAYDALVQRLGPVAGGEVREIGWMIEELRVSLFAQHLGTRGRVSSQRILRALAGAEAATLAVG